MGWKRGQWWAICDVCGFKFLSGQLKERWDGLMVDEACYETRHPQEFIKAVKEAQPPWTNPEGDGLDVSPDYTLLQYWVDGYAVGDGDVNPYVEELI